MTQQKNNWDRFEELINETEELESPGKERDALIVSSETDKENSGKELTVDDVFEAYAGLVSGLQPNTVIMHPSIWQDLMAMETSGNIELAPPIGVIPVSGLVEPIPADIPVPYHSSHSLHTTQAMNYVRQQLQNVMEQTGPNLDALEASVASSLSTMREQGAIQNFMVDGVEEGATPDTVFVQIRIQPTFSLEQINIVIGANLEE